MDQVQIQPEEEKQRPIHPNGSFAAVCVDVIDLGKRVVEWQGKKKGKPTIALVFRTTKKSPDWTDPESGETKPGWPFELAQEFTMSMDPKSNLRKFLEGWRGKKFTSEELGEAFNLTAEVADKAGMISVVHRVSKSNGKTYANIGGMLPLPEGMTAPEVSEYERAEFWAQKKERYAVEFENYMSDVGDMGETPF